MTPPVYFGRLIFLLLGFSHGCSPLAGTVSPGEISQGASAQTHGTEASSPGSSSASDANQPSATHLLTLVNRCTQVLWANDGNATHLLAPGQSRKSVLPWGFAGRVWARSDCPQTGPDQATCAQDIPLTLAEFKLDGWMSLDFYDVSLVDAFNLPLAIAPIGGHGDCKKVSCDKDLLALCPQNLRLADPAKGTLACLSGCQKYKTDAACCQNANGTAQTCPSPETATFFKTACPDAYSYAFDDATSVVSCQEPTEYVVTFCPDA